MIIYTIGHSTRTLKEFIELLKEYSIEQVIDVRTVPKSRYAPQFNQDRLKKTLKQAGIKYFHSIKLGGFRHAKKDSVNLGWKNFSFRGFADYMQTEDFEEGIKELLKLSKNKKTAIMCAEAVPWRCHRSLVSDILTHKKINVIHILSKTNSYEHKITPFARFKKNKIYYPA